MDIVAFPFHDWRKTQAQGVRTRDGHLLHEFGSSERVRKVLIVDRPVSIAELVVRRGAPRVRGERIAERRLGAWSATLTQVDGRLVVLDVIVPSLLGVIRRRRGWWFDVFRDPRMTSLTAWATCALDMVRPAAIAWTPTVAPVLHAIPFSRVVFDSLDNWITHPALRANKADAIEGYQMILPGASAVVVSAPATADVLAEWRPPQVIPNGVDIGRFQHATARPRDLPQRPVVGYAGKLAERIDVELVEGVAAALPGVSFVFVGAVLHRSVKRLSRVPNVTLLGDRSPDDLPSYLAHFDVAWIPHRVGEGETGGDPIKLYEYWAAGRQVVTTAIDGSGGWIHSAFVARDAQDAATLIGGLLDGSIAGKPVGVELARTWHAIASRLLELLEPDGSSARRASPGPSGE